VIASPLNCFPLVRPVYNALSKVLFERITISVIMRVNVLFGMTFMKVMSLLSITVSADCCKVVGGGGNLGGAWCAGSSTHILSNPSNLDGTDGTPFCGHGGKHLVYLTYQV